MASTTPLFSTFHKCNSSDLFKIMAIHSPSATPFAKSNSKTGASKSSPVFPLLSFLTGYLFFFFLICARLGLVHYFSDISFLFRAFCQILILILGVEF